MWRHFALQASEDKTIEKWRESTKDIIIVRELLCFLPFLPFLAKKVVQIPDLATPDFYKDFLTFRPESGTAGRPTVPAGACSRVFFISSRFSIYSHVQ